MIAKRIFDLMLSISGIILLTPLFLAVALWIKIETPGPVFYRQVRVGRFGRTFRIYKFRTMCLGADGKGKQITVGNDPRITSAGSFLRRHKIDELPQLFNVALGEMSLVGPRPEVPRYVEMYPKSVRDVVLSVPPGITDFASIEYRDESSILGTAEDAERDYIQKVMPVKLRYYEKYVAERSLWLDIKLIFATLRALAK